MSEPHQPEVAAPVTEIRAQVERIVSSQALAGSDQLKRFLRQVVERTLNGQSDLLKEYNLGLEVFQRPPSYDPKLDPIVRVQARRLRAKLGEYYAGEGAQDPLVIQIPRGAYVPVFETKPNPTVASQEGQAATGRSLRPRLWLMALAGVLIFVPTAILFSGRHVAPPDVERSVAVLPLQMFTANNSGGYVGDQVAEVLTTELAKRGELRVLSRTTASRYRESRLSLPEIARALGVRWVIEGGVGFEGRRVYIKLRAVDAVTDRKVWADVFDCDTSDVVPAANRAADAISEAILGNIRSRER